MSNQKFIVMSHEWRRMQRDKAVLILFILFAGIAAYASWNGRQWVASRALALESIQNMQESDHAATMARLKSATDRNPEMEISPASVALGWNRPILPLTALSQLAVGQADGYAFDARFHAMTPKHAIFDATGSNLANPEIRAAGVFDLAAVVVFLLPLFLIAATCDTWALEKESGTDALLLSAPVNPQTLLAAKAAAKGGFLLLASVLLMGLLVIDAGIGRIAAAMIVTALYGVFWLFISALISWLAQSVGQAALTLIGTWVIIVVVMPATLSATLDAVAPMPSRALYMQELRELQQEWEKQEAPASVGQASAADRLRASLDGARKRDAFFDDSVEGYFSLQTHSRFFRSLARTVSPPILVETLLEKLAGSDSARALMFRQQVLAYFEQVQGHIDNNAEPLPDLTLAEAESLLPQFRFDEPSWFDGRFLIDLLLLSVWCVTAWLLASFLTSTRKDSPTEDVEWEISNARSH